jgi:hypothetical protein
MIFIPALSFILSRMVGRSPRCGAYGWKLLYIRK